LAPLSGSVTKSGEQTEQEVSVGKQGEQGGISQGGDEEELEGRFKSQLGVGKTARHFDLPASGVSKNDLPGLFRRVGWFGGEEVPGFASIA
jgi:hypothetical protein